MTEPTTIRADVVVPILYRFEDVVYAAPFDDEGRLPGRVAVELRRANARRRFACPTVEEARASFIARKRAQIRIYEARTRRAREALAIARDASDRA